MTTRGAQGNGISAGGIVGLEIVEGYDPFYSRKGRSARPCIRRIRVPVPTSREESPRLGREKTKMLEVSRPYRNGQMRSPILREPTRRARLAMPDSSTCSRNDPPTGAPSRSPRWSRPSTLSPKARMTATRLHNTAQGRAEHPGTTALGDCGSRPAKVACHS